MNDAPIPTVSLTFMTFCTTFWWDPFDNCITKSKAPIRHTHENAIKELKWELKSEMNEIRNTTPTRYLVPCTTLPHIHRMTVFSSVCYPEQLDFYYRTFSIKIYPRILCFNVNFFRVIYSRILLFYHSLLGLSVNYSVFCQSMC